MFLDFLERPDSAGAGLFILNGGATTLASYAGPGGSFEIPEAHIRFLNELKLFHETDTHFFVHAGVPNQPLSVLRESAEEHEMQLLWSRQPFLSSLYKWEKVVVHGHTPTQKCQVRPNRINIDTGCVYDGALTALETSSMKFYQVEKGVKNEAPLFPRMQDQARAAVRFSGRMPVLAGRPGENPGPFQTLNYTQFGLLIEEVSSTQSPQLGPGDTIEGRIGDEGDAAIRFSGEVVRTETRGERAVLGVRLDWVYNGDTGRRRILKSE